MQASFLTAAGFIALACCAAAFDRGPQTAIPYGSMLLSENSFVPVRSLHCLPEKFVWTEPAVGPNLQLGVKEACARTCWGRADCRGFRLSQQRPFGTVCSFFTFDSCTEDLIDSGCDSREVVWLRWRPQSPGLSHHSPLCPIGFQGYRQGSARFRLVSVAEQPEGWLGGLHECRHPNGLVKFADADTVQEAAYLRSMLKDSKVEAAYLGGYLGFNDGQLQWIWQPCAEPISEAVLQSGIVSLWHNITVIASERWNGEPVEFAVCECIDPFLVPADEA